MLLAASLLIGTLLGTLFFAIAGLGKLLPGHPMHSVLSLPFDKAIGPYWTFLWSSSDLPSTRDWFRRAKCRFVLHLCAMGTLFWHLRAELESSSRGTSPLCHPWNACYHDRGTGL